MKNTAVVILAAGKGKRMKSGDMPKVLAPLSEKPLIEYVLNTVQNIRAKKTVLIVGHQKEKVKDFIEKSGFDNIEYAHQEQQLGTGHAVMMAEKNLSDFQGDVLILAGDVPLLTSETISKFIVEHNNHNSKVSVLSTTAPDATGYGRIVRDSTGNFIKITEEKDADDDIKKIQEINSGIFLVDSDTLFDSLKQTSNKNAQKEYYLTDIIEILKAQNAPVFAFNLAKFDELQGINSPEDLKRAEEVLKKMINKNV